MTISARRLADACDLQYRLCLFQAFSHFDLAAPGDKHVVDADGQETSDFVDPLRVKYRDVTEVWRYG
jgi:hypothetical protein